MDMVSFLRRAIAGAISEKFDRELPAEKLQIMPTRTDFEGDFTLVTFPLASALSKAPPQIAEEIGAFLIEKYPEVSAFNVVKGFLNLSLSANFWLRFLEEVEQKDDWGSNSRGEGQKLVIEYCSPNTNKPLHLGHLRNMLLGASCALLQEELGKKVWRVQVINDRGIAICKSMLAWQLFGKGETPENTGIKGDHFVGKWYVAFEKQFMAEYEAWQASEEARAVFAERRKKDQTEKDFFKVFKNEYFNTYSQLGRQAREMLLRWEQGEPDTRALWAQMNGWVYAGFEETFEKLGISFDKNYYESDTYLLGREMVEKGLEKGLFFKAEDGSVQVDLEDVGLGTKVLLRGDGTTLYITQDLGTAHLRYEDFAMDEMTYVVADEQNYHFKVLFELLKRLGEPYADKLYHLSYGMVELPEGKMKSREGTVVDADDLIAEVIAEARKNAEERGGQDELPPEQREEINRKVGLAALKFYLLKVNPAKWMTFNPAESVDLQGQTGPYVQYAYVRIRGLERRIQKEGISLSESVNYEALHPSERALLMGLHQFPSVVEQAALEYDPSHLASHLYQLAKTFNKMWHELPIFSAGDVVARAFRLRLARVVGRTLHRGMALLGIEMPERM
ncbi:MAG TPA: arginine--tRNA ligase [Phaeodactylibacter sp.]|nr:arginine--tRNA ligase [Phaeodactylibacter sp.]